jgi:predicted nucleic acid-binding protein
MGGLCGQSCSAVLQSVSSGRLKASISALVPLEVANALRKYRLGREVVGEVRAILSLPMEVYPVEPSDVSEGAEIYGEGEGSPYDCVHAAIMRRYGINEIVSADKDFDRIKSVKRLDPKKSFSGTLKVSRSDS